MSTRKAVPTKVRSVLLQRELDATSNRERIPVPTNIRSRILERGEKLLMTEIAEEYKKSKSKSKSKSKDLSNVTINFMRNNSSSDNEKYLKLLKKKVKDLN
jgi:hypothetical protein